MDHPRRRRVPGAGAWLGSSGGDRSRVHPRTRRRCRGGLPGPHRHGHVPDAAPRRTWRARDRRPEGRALQTCAPDPRRDHRRCRRWPPPHRVRVRGRARARLRRCSNRRRPRAPAGARRQPRPRRLRHVRRPHPGHRRRVPRSRHAALWPRAFQARRGGDHQAHVSPARARGRRRAVRRHRLGRSRFRIGRARGLSSSAWAAGASFSGRRRAPSAAGPRPRAATRPRRRPAASIVRGSRCRPGAWCRARPAPRPCRRRARPR